MSLLYCLDGCGGGASLHSWPSKGCFVVVHGHRADHIAVNFVPFLCFAEQMAEAWSLALEAAKVPEAARQKLIQLGYETQDAFNFDDDDTFKAFVKQYLLVEWKPDGVTEQTWFFHPIVGKLKAVWKKAQGVRTLLHKCCQLLLLLLEVWQGLWWVTARH